MAEISDEKREQMNRLYHAAIEFRHAQLEFCDKVSCGRLKDMLDAGAALHQILREINGGQDPVHFEDRTTNICAVASMLAGN